MRWVHVWDWTICGWRWIYTARHFRHFAGIGLCAGVGIHAPSTPVLDRAPMPPDTPLVIGPAVHPELDVIRFARETPVPEPGSIVVFAGAVGVLAMIKRGRRV